mgnify:FL=1
MKRVLRTVVFLTLAMPGLAWGADASRSMTVHKTTTCGCCKHWVSHLEEQGFEVEVMNRENLDDVKHRHGVSGRFSSCHTGVDDSGRYAFEGHIPAYLVARFLDAPPVDARALTVPGMPVGSPGMEMGERFQPYDVLLIRRDGSVEVYETVSNQAQQYARGK